MIIKYERWKDIALPSKSIATGGVAAMLRNKFAQFMIGRCGPDQFSITTMWAALAFWFLSAITGWVVFSLLYFVCIVYTLFRILSRNIPKRREENARFQAAVRPIQRKLSTARGRMADKEHRYFRCPNCKQQMRVPRGKGRIQVTCRSCGITFEEKS